MEAPKTASEILKENNVEIDSSDERSPEEIARFLGLIASTSGLSDVKRRESRPYFVR